MDFGHIVSQMIVLCVPILMGYAASKLGFLDEKMDNALSRLIINVTLPCLIIASVTTTTDLPSTHDALELMGFSAVGYVLALLVAYVLPALTGVRGVLRGIYGFAIAFGNVGFIGYPVLSAIYGPKAVVYAAIAAIPNSLFLYSVGDSMIKTVPAGTEQQVEDSESADKRKMGLGRRVRELLGHIINPTFVASIVLLALVLARINDLGVLGQGLAVVGNFTTPAVLLVTGSTLASYNPLSMFTNWRAYVAALGRLLGVPLLMLLVMRGFIADDFIRGVIVIGAAMPVASVGVLFCLLRNADVKPMMQTTFISIVASVLTIPLLATLV